MLNYTRTLCPHVLSINVAQHANSANSCGQCAAFGSTDRAAQSLCLSVPWTTLNKLLFSG